MLRMSLAWILLAFVGGSRASFWETISYSDGPIGCAAFINLTSNASVDPAACRSTAESLVATAACCGAVASVAYSAGGQSCVAFACPLTATSLQPWGSPAILGVTTTSIAYFEAKVDASTRAAIGCNSDAYCGGRGTAASLAGGCSCTCDITHGGLHCEVPLDAAAAAGEIVLTFGGGSAALLAAEEAALVAGLRTATAPAGAVMAKVTRSTPRGSDTRELWIAVSSANPRRAMREMHRTASTIALAAVPSRPLVATESPSYTGNASGFATPSVGSDAYASCIAPGVNSASLMSTGVSCSVAEGTNSRLLSRIPWVIRDLDVGATTVDAFEIVIDGAVAQATVQVTVELRDENGTIVAGTGSTSCYLSASPPTFPNSTGVVGTCQGSQLTCVVYPAHVPLSRVFSISVKLTSAAAITAGTPCTPSAAPSGILPTGANQVLVSIGARLAPRVRLSYLQVGEPATITQTPDVAANGLLFLLLILSASFAGILGFIMLGGLALKRPLPVALGFLGAAFSGGMLFTTFYLLARIPNVLDASTDVVVDVYRTEKCAVSNQSYLPFRTATFSANGECVLLRADGLPGARVYGKALCSFGAGANSDPRYNGTIQVAFARTLGECAVAKFEHFLPAFGCLRGSASTVVGPVGMLDDGTTGIGNGFVEIRCAAAGTLSGRSRNLFVPSAAALRKTQNVPVPTTSPWEGNFVDKGSKRVFISDDATHRAAAPLFLEGVAINWETAPSAAAATFTVANATAIAALGASAPLRLVPVRDLAGDPPSVSKNTQVAIATTGISFGADATATANPTTAASFFSRVPAVMRSTADAGAVAGPVTFTFWLRAGVTSVGFPFLLTDDVHDSATFENVAVSVLQQAIENDMVTGEVVAPLAVYAATYVNGPARRLHFAFAVPPSSAGMATWQVGVGGTAVNTQKTISDIFDGQWHQIAISYDSYLANGLAQLHVDAQTNAKSGVYMKCVDQQRMLRPVRSLPTRGGGATRTLPLVPSVAARRVAAFEGGALYVGAFGGLGGNDTNFDGASVFGLEFHDQALSQGALAKMATPTIFNSVSGSARNSRIVGWIFVGFACAGFLLQCILAIAQRLGEPATAADADPILPGEEDMTEEERDAARRQREQERLSQGAGKAGGQAGATSGAKSGATAGSGATKAASGASGSASTLGPAVLAVKQITFVIPAFMTVAQSMMLYFDSFDMPSVYVEAGSWAFFAFSLDINVAAPTLFPEVVFAIQFVLCLAATAGLYLLGVKDDDAFRTEIVEPMLEAKNDGRHPTAVRDLSLPEPAHDAEEGLGLLGYRIGGDLVRGTVGRRNVQQHADSVVAALWRDPARVGTEVSAGLAGFWVTDSRGSSSQVEEDVKTIGLPKYVLEALVYAAGENDFVADTPLATACGTFELIGYSHCNAEEVALFSRWAGMDVSNESLEEAAAAFAAQRAAPGSLAYSQRSSVYRSESLAPDVTTVPTAVEGLSPSETQLMLSAAALVRPLLPWVARYHWVVPVVVAAADELMRKVAVYARRTANARWETLIARSFTSAPDRVLWDRFNRALTDDDEDINACAELGRRLFGAPTPVERVIDSVDESAAAPAAAAAEHGGDEYKAEDSGSPRGTGAAAVFGVHLDRAFNDEAARQLVSRIGPFLTRAGIPLSEETADDIQFIGLAARHHARFSAALGMLAFYSDARQRLKDARGEKFEYPLGPEEAGEAEQLPCAVGFWGLLRGSDAFNVAKDVSRFLEQNFRDIVQREAEWRLALPEFDGCRFVRGHLVASRAEPAPEPKGSDEKEVTPETDVPLEGDGDSTKHPDGTEKGRITLAFRPVAAPDGTQPEDLPVEVDGSVVRCPVHDLYLTLAVEELHGKVRKHNPEAWPCALSHSVVFKATCCDTVEEGIRPCDHKVFYVCRDPRCNFSVCGRCLRRGFLAKLAMSLISTWQMMTRMGLLSLIGLVVVLVAQLLYLPSLTSAVTVASHHPLIQCRFPGGYDNPKGDFLILVLISGLVVIEIGVGLPIFFFMLVHRRKSMLLDSGALDFEEPEFWGKQSDGDWPTTPLQILSATISTDTWDFILSRDRSMFKSIYEQYEFRVAAIHASTLVFKIALLLVMWFVDQPNSLERIIAVGCVEVVQMFFYTLTDPFIDPWLDFLQKTSGVHQTVQVGLVALHRANTIDKPSNVNVAYGMLAVSGAYIIVVIVVITFVVVIPVVKLVQQLRRQAELEAKAEEEATAAARAEIKAGAHDSPPRGDKVKESPHYKDPRRGLHDDEPPEEPQRSEMPRPESVAKTVKPSVAPDDLEPLPSSGVYPEYSRPDAELAASQRDPPDAAA